MLEDKDLRATNSVLFHLEQLEKSYKKDKHKRVRDLLLHQSLGGGSDCLEAVYRFKKDPQVLDTFKSEAIGLLQGHVSQSVYNLCLGLLAARLMFWCSISDFSPLCS